MHLVRNRRQLRTLPIRRVWDRSPDSKEDIVGGAEPVRPLFGRQHQPVLRSTERQGWTVSFEFIEVEEAHSTPESLPLDSTESNNF
jgi:hypothetical protein